MIAACDEVMDVTWKTVVDGELLSRAVLDLPVEIAVSSFLV